MGMGVEAAEAVPGPEDDELIKRVEQVGKTKWAATAAIEFFALVFLRARGADVVRNLRAAARRGGAATPSGADRPAPASAP